MRMDPPPSLPVQAGNIPAATAAADPPDEPPGVRLVSHGLRVTPCSGVFVKLTAPNSDAVVSPTRTAPAWRGRSASGVSAAAVRVREAGGAGGAGEARTPAWSLTPNRGPA